MFGRKYLCDVIIKRVRVDARLKLKALQSAETEPSTLSNSFCFSRVLSSKKSDYGT